MPPEPSMGTTEDLDRYWDRLVLGEAEHASPVDPDDETLLQALHRDVQVRDPDPSFQRQLRRDLLRTPTIPVSSSPWGFPVERPLDGHSVPRRSPGQQRHWAGTLVAMVLLLAIAVIAAVALTGILRHVPVVTILAPAVDTQNVPLYRGDAARTGVMPGPAVDQPPSERWQVSFPGQIKSAVAIVDGVLYFGGGDGQAYALDPASGAEDWHIDLGQPLSTPAVIGGMVYVSGNDGTLYALEASTGAERWTAVASRQDASVVVVDRVVYTGGGDGALSALDAATGAIRWQTALGAATSSSPAVADGLVYIGSRDGVLHAVDAQAGKPRWDFRPDGGTLITPAVADGLVFQATANGKAGDRNALYALDAQTGTEVWRVGAPPGQGFFGPAVGKGTVYVPGTDGQVLALDTATGQERWRFATGDLIDAAPALVDDTLYVAGQDRTLYALDTATGEERWRFDLVGPVSFGPTLSGGVLYVGTTFGVLRALGTVPSGSVGTVSPPE